RLAGAGWAVWFYLYKTVLPLNLMTVYPRWRIDAANVWSYVPGLLVVGAFLLCWRARRSWGRAWLVGLAYFVAMLLPVLGFVDIGFMSYSLVADRWQYFAILGPIALASAWFSSRFKIQSSKFGSSGSSPSGALSPSGLLLGVVLLLTLGGLTWRQSALYANSETLWQAALAANPGCWAAHYNLGVALVQKGRVDEAIAQFQMALQLKPDYAEAHNNLGTALVQKGGVDEAIAQYQVALQLKPDYADAHNNLGTALLQKGRMAQAITQYRKALQIEPADPK